MVDSADSLCASCQVLVVSSLRLTPTDQCISASLVHNAESRHFSFELRDLMHREMDGGWQQSWAAALCAWAID
jgi:hypothetical protein